MLAKIAAADSASTVIKKYSVFIYSEAEPHAKYAIYKHTRKFRVLQYMNEKILFRLGFIRVGFIQDVFLFFDALPSGRQGTHIYSGVLCGSI